MSAILRQVARTLKSLIPLFENAERIEYPGQPGIGQFILVSDETAQEIAKTLRMASANIATEAKFAQVSNEVKSDIDSVALDKFLREWWSEGVGDMMR